MKVGDSACGPTDGVVVAIFCPLIRRMHFKSCLDWKHLGIHQEDLEDKTRGEESLSFAWPAATTWMNKVADICNVGQASHYIKNVLKLILTSENIGDYYSYILNLDCRGLELFTLQITRHDAFKI